MVDSRAPASGALQYHSSARIAAVIARVPSAGAPAAISAVRRPALSTLPTAASIAAASASSFRLQRRSHPHAEDGADRVGLVLAGDIRRAAVDPLVDAGAAGRR